MRRARAYAVSGAAIVAVFLGSGCRRSDLPVGGRGDAAIGGRVGASEVSALRDVLAGKPAEPVGAAVWADVREFYRRRNGSPAWVSARSASKATTALQVLRRAREHGLSVADYREPQLAQLVDAFQRPEDSASDRAQRVAEVDARLTAALLELGRDVALGRAVPRRIDPRWRAQRQAPDLVATLDDRAGAGNLVTWLDAVRPPHRAYAALQDALIDLYCQQDKGGWPHVPSITFKPGTSDPSVALLRERLAASGELPGAAATGRSPVYDKDVEAAVRVFQSRHSIEPTGIADQATVAALNVPIHERIRQVGLNLERWRWMPEELGQRHVFVNIPAYQLAVVEDGHAVLGMRVIVGKRGSETPVFSAEITSAVFSPYWNIPDAIVAGETAPAAVRDPDYLDRNNIEVLRASGRSGAPVDPSGVNWSDRAELRRLAFRQRPGPDNALGRVKFLLPNDFDVYLHDTPNHAPFARARRALSHGCIRLEKPVELAQYVLRDDPEWDGPRMQDAMQAPVEQPARLKHALPVHIVYFTAWADEAGALNFAPDVYSYDAKQIALEAAGAHSLTSN